MLTHLKNIAVFLDETEASTQLGDYAAALARKHRAHLIGLYGITRAERVTPEGSFARGTQAIQAVIEHRKTADEEKVLTVGRHFAALSRAYDVSSEFRIIWIDQEQEDISLHSLHCDLVIMGHPKPQGVPANWTADRLIRSTGVPVLLVPEQRQGNAEIERVLVAWNASRESRRAITDAMPFITTAKQVTVLVVDAAKGDHPYGQEPGADVALHLARHGARVDVVQVTAEGESVSAVILAQAEKQQADLIVVGARSHTRRRRLFLVA